MNEANRLDLFKEVAGTRVYDEKKAESEKIMRDTSKYFYSLCIFFIFVVIVFSE